MEKIKKIGRVGAWVGIGLIGAGVAVGAVDATGIVNSTQLVLGIVGALVLGIKAVIEAFKKD